MAEKDNFKLLKVGEQSKLPIYVTLKFYPIGPVILVCEYLNTGTNKKEEIRILLPVHINKTVTILSRDEELRKK